jgi:hypothetical protein
VLVDPVLKNLLGTGTTSTLPKALLGRRENRGRKALFIDVRTHALLDLVPEFDPQRLAHRAGLALARLKLHPTVGIFLKRIKLTSRQASKIDPLGRMNYTQSFQHLLRIMKNMSSTFKRSVPVGQAAFPLCSFMGT